MIVGLERRGGVGGHVPQLPEHGPVQRLADQISLAGPALFRAVAPHAITRGEGQHEPGRVEELDGQPPAHPQLGRIEDHVGASRPLAAQYRIASEPCWRSESIGVTTFPRDFDIFFRSGSRIQPEIAACRHGATPYSWSARSTV